MKRYLVVLKYSLNNVTYPVVIFKTKKKAKEYIEFKNKKCTLPSGMKKYDIKAIDYIKE